MTRPLEYNVFCGEGSSPKNEPLNGNVGKFQGCFCTSRSSLETRMVAAFVRIVGFLSFPSGASGDIGFTLKASNTNGLRAIEQQYLH